MDKVLFSSASIHWRTPDSIISVVKSFANIRLDPCASPHSRNHFADVNFIGPAEGGKDGLLEPWGGAGGIVWVNSPYGSALKAWADKVNKESALGTEMVVLCAARSDTKWWKTMTIFASCICLVEGRIKFELDGVANSSPAFPSALIYHGPDDSGFNKKFKQLGAIWKNVNDLDYLTDGSP